LGPESLELTALKPDKAKIKEAEDAQRTAQNSAECQAMPGL
jgi:hypothetical protein